MRRRRREAELARLDRERAERLERMRRRRSELQLLAALPADALDQATSLRRRGAARTIQRFARRSILSMKPQPPQRSSTTTAPSAPVPILPPAKIFDDSLPVGDLSREELRAAIAAIEPLVPTPTTGPVAAVLTRLGAPSSTSVWSHEDPSGREPTPAAVAAADHDSDVYGATSDGRLALQLDDHFLRLRAEADARIARDERRRALMLAEDRGLLTPEQPEAPEAVRSADVWWAHMRSFWAHRADTAFQSLREQGVFDEPSADEPRWRSVPPVLPRTAELVDRSRNLAERVLRAPPVSAVRSLPSVQSRLADASQAGAAATEASDGAVAGPGAAADLGGAAGTDDDDDAADGARAARLVEVLTPRDAGLRAAGERLHRATAASLDPTRPWYQARASDASDLRRMSRPVASLLPETTAAAAATATASDVGVSWPRVLPSEPRAPSSFEGRVSGAGDADMVSEGAASAAWSLFAIGGSGFSASAPLARGAAQGSAMRVSSSSSGVPDAVIAAAVADAFMAASGVPADGLTSLPGWAVRGAMSQVGVLDPWDASLGLLDARGVVDQRRVTAARAVAAASKAASGAPVDSAANSVISSSAAHDEVDKLVRGAGLSDDPLDSEAVGSRDAELAAWTRELHAALDDPAHPLSLDSTLAALPAFVTPLSAVSSALSAATGHGKRPSASGITGDDRSMPWLAGRPGPASTPSILSQGASPTDRVLATVEALRRQSARLERLAEARQEARKLSTHAAAAGNADVANTPAEEPPNTDTLTAPHQAPAGVALPLDAGQRLRSEAGAEFLVLTREQIAAISAAVNGSDSSHHEPAVSRQPPASSLPSAARAEGTARPARQRQPVDSVFGSVERAEAWLNALVAGETLPEPASTLWPDGTDTESYEVPRPTSSGGLSDGARSVGVAIKSTYGLAATPSAPSGSWTDTRSDLIRAAVINQSRAGTAGGSGGGRLPVPIPPPPYAAASVTGRQLETPVGRVTGLALETPAAASSAAATPDRRHVGWQTGERDQFTTPRDVEPSTVIHRASGASSDGEETDDDDRSSQGSGRGQERRRVASLSQPSAHPSANLPRRDGAPAVARKDRPPTAPLGVSRVVGVQASPGFAVSSRF